MGVPESEAPTKEHTEGPEGGPEDGQHEEMLEEIQKRESSIYLPQREMLVKGISLRKWPGGTEAGMCPV